MSRKKATVVKHDKGFFLAINGDLNRREVVLNGFNKSMRTVKQYYGAITKTNGAGYTSYDYDPIAIVTCYDLSNINDELSIDDIWDPSTHKVDAETGEVIQLYTPEPPEPPSTKELVDTFFEVLKEEADKETNKEIMENSKTTTDTKRSEAAKKGWETRRKLQAQMKAEQLAKENAEFDKLWDEAHEANAKYEQELNDAKLKQAEQEMAQAEAKIRIKQRAKAVAKHTKLLRKLGLNTKPGYLDQYTIEEINQDIERIKQTISDNKTEDSPQSNNSVNTNEMNTENNASNDAQTKKPFINRARRGLAKGTEVGVTVSTDVLIGALMVGSDILYSMAEGVAWTQAAAVKPLGLHPDATRRELKEKAISRAEHRTAVVYGAPKAIIGAPSKLVAMAKAARQKNDDTIVDVNHTEVVA